MKHRARSILTIAAAAGIMSMFFWVTWVGAQEPGVPPPDEVFSINPEAIMNSTNARVNNNKNAKATNATAPDAAPAVEIPENENGNTAPATNGGSSGRNVNATDGSSNELSWLNIAIIVGVILSLAINAVLLVRLLRKNRPG